MREKNIFIYKLFLSLNISDFSLFFYIKTARSCQALHFLKIWSEDQSYPTSPPLSAEEWGVGGGGCTRCPNPSLDCNKLHTLIRSSVKASQIKIDVQLIPKDG